MKIEKINNNKIKVLIDEQEARENNISLKKISQNTPEVQEMFRIAIQLAEEKTDFSVEGGKLFVEAVQDEINNGFGIMITKVCNEDDLNDAINNCQHKNINPASLKTHILKKASVVEKFLYKFSSFDNLCLATEYIFDIYSGKSTLYKYNDFYYLYLVPEGSSNICEIDSLISEYGSKVKNSLYLHGRLNEYGEIMIKEGALNILSRYFSLNI